ncbi:methyl-accepting chemotaxis protein [Rhizobium sp. SG2393]|uniref:methyl-accepting chemotaxis protein n=1 Tax=Rhizobium sp. SG2393 TaxID=3276279 RepID=UPI00366CE056
MKIGTKLTIAFTLLVGTMLATAAANWNQVGTADEAADAALAGAATLRKVDGLLSAKIDQETGLRGYLISADPAFLGPYEQGRKALENTMNTLRQEWAGRPEHLARLDAFQVASEEWTRTIAEREIALMKDPATQAEARRIEASGTGKASMDAMRRTIGEMNTAATAEMQSGWDAQDNAIYATYRILGSASALSILLAFGAALSLIVSIARPIRLMTGYMDKLATGDTAGDVPAKERGDEIGAMANAVEVFRQAAITNKRLETEAEASRRQAEADRIRLAAEAEAAAQQRLTEATSGLAAGLKRLAAGDLSVQIEQPFAAEFEALRHDLNNAVTQLASTMGDVAQAAGTIDNGSREISSSADDLSKRTEQQAASLEETAAALDQITANVANSTKRAMEAREVAVQANSSAIESGKVVANAVEAMQKIEASSDQVANIIGVIDEIAFQTNLLALNAGVEAARAGEAGKGFAVVAQEVRELAQRSATAAKEIKDLIRNSSVEVKNGVELVEQTGKALKTIETYIVTFNHHMDAIATSSREQATGLAEVNTAVNQMDQVTQQNAAMVEETNAAGASLAIESARLRELMSQFQLATQAGHGTGHGAGHGAQRAYSRAA